MYILFLECSNYKTLDEADRSMNSPASPFNEKCDNAPTAWYRFSGAAGTMMPTSRVAKNMCGTNAPGWLDGQHPSQLGARIQATVCFHWENEPCKWSTQILIRNCGSFYVYLLPPAPHCNLRYCGNGIQSKNHLTFYLLTFSYTNILRQVQMPKFPDSQLNSKLKVGSIKENPSFKFRRPNSRT